MAKALKGQFLQVPVRRLHFLSESANSYPFALQEAINSLPQGERPKVLCSASAVGFYGSSLSQTFNEGSNSGSDYLAEVCREWEAAAQGAQIDRVVVVRVLLLGPSNVHCAQRLQK